MTLRPRPPLNYPDWPLHHFLQRSADRWPERTAVLFEGDRLTFRELDAWGTAFANALLGLGLGVGERVLLAATNRPEWLIAQHGASVAGASVVLGNSSWKSFELRHALELTQPVVVIADGQSIEALVECDDVLPPIRISLDDSCPPGWERFSDVVTTGHGRRPVEPHRDLRTAEALLPFSSGTTGLPKAVRHTHAGLVAATTQRLQAYDITDRDRIQYFMPLFNIFGVITASCSLAAGATLRLFRRFDAEQALTSMQDDRITIGLGAAPIAVAYRNSDLERYDISSVRYILWGATPILPDVAGEFTARTGVPWLGAYGTTEVGIASNPAHRLDLARLDTPGYPLSDVEIRIVDLETGDDVPPGSEGEIVVRSPGAMAGYLPEEETADVSLPEGWLRTGDVGWLEPNGWVHITDRAKEMIKVNGFAVAPAEIERVLFNHPAVADCAVYGMPDPRKGEVPKAAVVLRPGMQASGPELAGYVADQLATYKHVGEVAFVEVIPRNAGGKVLRRLLRDADLGLTPTS